MDALSLLFCKSPANRRAEQMIWIVASIVAVLTVLVLDGDALVGLWIAMSVAACLRYRAAATAHRLRSASNHINGIALLAIHEGKALSRRMASLAQSVAIAGQRRTAAARQAAFAQFGLTHSCIATRLLPIPISAARR
ncbi:MAG: hypothetical protein NDI91_04120 [Sulfuritalea sp.]|nr:hypothetical protein [Sulfuritalea sp.]